MIRRVVAAAVVALVPAFACRKPAPPSNGAAALGSALASSSATAITSGELRAIRVASDRRDAAAIPSTLAASPDPVARRAVSHALAEIADAAAIARLATSLSDEDPEVVAWSAYGIALPCDDADLPREARAKAARALAARALTLEGAAWSNAPKLDPWSAIAWGLGRCGGIEASRELARWLGVKGDRARAAAFALGAIAQKDGGLEDDVVRALLASPVEEAPYPFGRGDWSGRPVDPGLMPALRARLGAPGPSRLYAIRAIGRGPNDGKVDVGKPDDLRAIVGDAATPASELVEALRALHRLGSAGDAEIAAFVTRLAPIDATNKALLLGERFGPLRIAVALLGERLGKTAEGALRVVSPRARTPIPADVDATIARRIATLRCLAAAALHAGEPADPEVVQCAAHASSTGAGVPLALYKELDAIRDRARLAALDRGTVVDEKRDLLVRLSREGSLVVKEEALAIFARHPESREAPDVLARALAAKEVGLVAAAADAITARPSLANKKKKADDDAATPPSTDPASELDQAVRRALEGALARPLEEADSEAKASLVAAVAALRYDKGRPFAVRLCSDRVAALRKAAKLALDRLDPPGTMHACDVIADLGPADPLADKAGDAPQRITLTTDVGALTLALDPSIAPIEVARVVELVGEGFFDGVVVHRVEPGFVVQFGDRDGDGFGGAHTALRCETGPVPFARYDVGVALAGRDTGSSQLFVTLERTPHLDGSYPWLGHAEGAWSTLAEGDVILKAKVE